LPIVTNGEVGLQWLDRETPTWLRCAKLLVT